MSKKYKSKTEKNRKESAFNKPEFKPGNKPYCQFGKDTLNSNVPWTNIVNELLQLEFTNQSIADYAECPINTIVQILHDNHESLPFRSGARLLTLHSNHYSSC